MEGRTRVDGKGFGVAILTLILINFTIKLNVI